MKTINQVCKHVLTGGVADVADLVFFEIFFFILGADIASKAISFVIAVAIKFAGNKYWVFNKPEKDGAKKEAFYFLFATLIGFLINIASFSFFVNIKTGLSITLWRPICVILAMFITAAWNFPAYKFIVFKK